MTKRNLLLVSLLVVFGLATTAPSMFAVVGIDFFGSNNTNSYMRAEGDAEATGTITLSTTSTGTIKKGSAWYIAYNAPIAMNSNGNAASVTCLGDYAASLCAAFTPFTVGTPSLPWVSTPPYPIQPGVTHNQIALVFNNDVVFGAPTVGTTINIAVRVNIQGYPYGYSVVATVKAFYVTGFPMSIAPLYNAAYTVGEIGPTQALTVGFKDGPAHVLTCIGAKDIGYFDNDFSLRLTENWANALTSLSDEWSLENDTLADVPTNGSNILVTFTGIPPDVTIVPGSVYSCAEYPSGPHGCPGGALNITYGSDSSVTCSGTPSTCTQWFWYETNTTNTDVVENAVLHFKIYTHGPVPPNMGYQIQATVSLTDLETSAVPLDMPNFSIAETPTVSVVEFSDCVTKLLFPYINTFTGAGGAFSHFGTGIDFANTTWDPWNPTFDTGNLYASEHRGSAVPQSGSCTVYFYPANESTTQVYTTPVISAGGSFAFDVGSSATGFAGQSGYAIAICGFQNAYGFAEIYDNYGVGDPTATLAYLAYILPEPAFYHRSPAGDALGEEAIAPININKAIEKILMYGIGKGY